MTPKGRNIISWYRFNVPAAGSATTIASNSTVETQYKALYPAHNLRTTYAYNSTGQVIRQQSPDAGTCSVLRILF